MRSHKRYYLILLAVAVLGYMAYTRRSSVDKAPEKKSVAGVSAGAPAPIIPTVTVGKVGEAANFETRRYSGHVVSSSSVNLVARVAGEIMNVAFTEGRYVAKGDLLFELDPVRYEAAVKNSEAKVTEYKAKLTYAESSFSRASNLYDQKAASKDYMENYQSEFESTKALLAAAEASLVTSRDDLKNTKIVAPISGKIGISNFTKGNYVTPSSGVLATIVQMNPIRVTFSMSARDFLSMFGNETTLREKADVRLRLANDAMYGSPGSVEIVDNQADQRSDTIVVYAKFDNPDGVLVPGGTVTVFLSIKNGGKLPTVTPSAVMHDARSPYVYVVNAQNIAERRDVVLGPSDGQMQLIKSGLQPGETVVIDGMHKVIPGGAIKPDFRG